MATRMQQRRGTASQWTSANPVLNAGELGWESDTNKFKIGDGTNHWADLDYFIDSNSTVNPAFGTSIVFEGATADSYETTLQVTDPTDDRTITLPNVSGTVITTGNLSDITNIGVFTSTITMEGSTANDHELTISAGDPTADRTATFPDATGTVVLDSATQTLTNKTLTTPVISSITNGAATLTLPTSTGTIALTSDIAAGIVTETGTQTLTNKTLTSPVVSGLTLSDSSIVIEGSTANDFETTLTVTDPTADRTITIPDVTGTVVTTGNLSAITSVGTLASLTVTGDLTVNGTTTTINSTTLSVDDKNIVLGDVETPTDSTADGGGITLKGATDKTFNWVDATDSWTSSEHLFLSATKELRLADTDSTHYVGFKSPGTVSANKVWTLPATDGSAGQTLSTDGSAVLSWSTPAAGADEMLVLMGAY
jgi:Major tropism determinant N-terminal domain